MAATTNDATNQTEPAAATTDPFAGTVVTGKEAEKAVADFLASGLAPAGYSIGRDGMNAWVVRKV